MFKVGHNKTSYVPCELELITFGEQDVITTSGFTGTDDDLSDLLGGNDLM